jgi:predicted ABC-type ATPase
MSNGHPDVYIFAGPNGSGKTTIALEFLHHAVKDVDFINADAIAKGIAPINPEKSAMEAGRIMLRQLHKMVSAKLSFGMESTLAGRSYTRLFKEIKSRGYKIHIFFLWLPNLEIALQRIRERVRKGGS